MLPEVVDTPVLKDRSVEAQVDEKGHDVSRTVKRTFWNHFWDENGVERDSAVLNLSMRLSVTQSDDGEKPSSRNANWRLYSATCTRLGVTFASLTKRQRERLTWCADRVTETKTPAGLVIKISVVSSPMEELLSYVSATLQLCTDIEGWSPKSAKGRSRGKPNRR